MLTNRKAFSCVVNVIGVSHLRGSKQRVRYYIGSIGNDKEDVVVSYVTDVEGNLNYWNQYKRISKVLTQTINGMDLKNNCHLVYGGSLTTLM